MKTDSHKSVFNLKEAATYLGISVPTLVRLLESGTIPYRRVGQRWLIARIGHLVESKRLRKGGIL